MAMVSKGGYLNYCLYWLSSSDLQKRDAANFQMMVDCDDCGISRDN